RQLRRDLDRGPLCGGDRRRLRAHLRNRQTQAAPRGAAVGLRPVDRRRRPALRGVPRNPQPHQGRRAAHPRTAGDLLTRSGPPAAPETADGRVASAILAAFDEALNSACGRTWTARGYRPTTSPRIL